MGEEDVIEGCMDLGLSLRRTVEVDLDIAAGIEAIGVEERNMADGALGLLAAVAIQEEPDRSEKCRKVVEAVLGAELEDGALVVGGNGVKPSTVLGGKVLGVLLKVHHDHFLSGFFVSYLAARAARENPP